MCAKFQPDSSAAFLRKEINGLICREVWAAGLPLPSRQKLRMNPIRNFTQITRFLLEKNVRLCLTNRFDIPRQNACASYQN